MCSPGHWQPVLVIEVDVHHVPVNVLQLTHLVGPGVHHQVQRPLHSKVTDTDLKVHPVTSCVKKLLDKSICLPIVYH